MSFVKMENRIYPHYNCEMCGKLYVKKTKYKWIGMITKQEIYICRDCAYKEAYGTRDRSKAKKEKWIENE